MAGTLQGSRLFAQIAGDLAEQSDLRATIDRLMTLTIQLLGCEAATLWQLSPEGHTTMLGANDRRLARALDVIIRESDEGLVHYALTHRATVYMPDIAAETRWPRYTAALRDQKLPIAAALAFSLQLGEDQLGALGLYAAQPGYFTDQLIDIAGVLADHAAVALETASLADRNHHLQQALKTNRRIGMAIGILMALHHYGEQQAFDRPANRLPTHPPQTARHR